MDGMNGMALNAVLCVWNEEDIIESTVRHLFAQGCANVFIIDNGSTDTTVAAAVRAGATLAASFTTDSFNEDQKVAHLNAVVQHVNEAAWEERIWWLYVDADEFPNFDCDLTILEVLQHLDPSVRAIHGFLYNHRPSHQPYHIRGQHPADFQPVCVKTSSGKVPLLRYDKGRKHLFSIGGAHDFITHNEPIPTVQDFLRIHHFPFRSPEFTFPRAKILAEKRNAWYKKFMAQDNSPNCSMYERRYAALQSNYDAHKDSALKTKTLQYTYRYITRWYDIYEEKKFSGSEYEIYICNAIYYFFNKEYDIALCRFNDALNVCDDAGMKLWLMMKMAECLYTTDANDTYSIITTIKKYNHAELNEYISDDFGYITGDCAAAAGFPRDVAAGLELSQSVFPDTAEQGYKKLLAKSRKNILLKNFSLEQR